MTKIEHRPPTPTTQRKVLAESGNQCAWATCSRRIVSRDFGTIVGKICHIKARSEGGKRFDYSQSEEQNRSRSNLIAMCGEHHDVIDDRDDVFTVEKLHDMKSGHEAKLAKDADRGWVTFPNTITKSIGEMNLVVNFWIDRDGEPRIYSDRELVISKTVLKTYQDLHKLCQLYEVVEDNPNVKCKDALQKYVRLNKSEANLDASTPWTPITHILVLMAEIPEITFGEFVKYFANNGDLASLLIQREGVLQKKIEGLSKP